MPKALSTASPSSSGYSATAVRIPAMPKGVEHDNTGLEVLGYPDVTTSLMPQGVEHLIRWYAPSCVPVEDISDAKRR